MQLENTENPNVDLENTLFTVLVKGRSVATRVHHKFACELTQRYKAEDQGSVWMRESLPDDVTHNNNRRDYRRSVKELVEKFVRLLQEEDRQLAFLDPFGATNGRFADGFYVEIDSAEVNAFEVIEMDATGVIERFIEDIVEAHDIYFSKPLTSMKEEVATAYRQIRAESFLVGFVRTGNNNTVKVGKYMWIDDFHSAFAFSLATKSKHFFSCESKSLLGFE